MYKRILFLKILVALFLVNTIFAQPNWPLLKSIMAPSVSLPAEFGTPYKQPLSVGGWEDGIFISRDGLNLYCIYVPVDLFSWTFFGPADPAAFSPYSRGPTFGMDLITNPVGASEWLQADILYSHRNTLADSFAVWQLSNLANPVYSEGAPQHNGTNSSSVDLFVYTSNNTTGNSTDIVLLQSVGINPVIQSTFLPAPVNTLKKEDNPHIERLDSVNLVLFFDSDDRPGGLGQLDIWYSTSPDNGVSWINPLQVSTLNTVAGGEQQPHLYKDSSGDWYIYYTGGNATTGKPEIFRAKQNTIGNWDSWTNIESVVGAGNAFGVGEPTLTQNGDLSFVVLYADTINGTPTDKYDADPWFLPKLSVASVSSNFISSGPSLFIYPNPATEMLTVSFSNQTTKEIIQLYNSMGEIIKEEEIFRSSIIDLKDLSAGIYFVRIKNHSQLNTRFIKN